MFNKIIAIVNDRLGAVAIEYALIASLVGLATVGGLTVVGTNLNTMYTEIAETILHATR